MLLPVRIAHVVEAVEGGCKKHVLELAGGLDPGRFRQTVIFSPNRDPGFPEAIAEATGGAVEMIPWNVRRSIRPFSDLAGYRSLRRLFRERKFDVIHCHSAKAGIIGRLAARDLDAGTIYTPHCFPFAMGAGAISRAVYVRLERYAGRFTDRLIAVAPSEARLAEATRIVPRERIATIENGIDAASLDVDVNVEQKRAELGIEGSGPVVLSVGALRPQKGYRYLIEAASSIAQQHRGVVVLIAGEGTLRRELEELIARRGVENHVRLLGARGDVPELLRIPDCIAMPSLWEGGPYALLEAMAVGAPLVGSRIPGIVDWITDGETGRLAEPADPESLAKAVTKALSNGPESHRMAEAARNMVLRRNTKDRWLREMSALYEDVVGAST